MGTRTRWTLGVLAIAVFSTGMAWRAQVRTDPKTPEDLVATYDSLAHAILALKKTESNLVMSILATTYEQAGLRMHRALEMVASGKDARAQIEAAAELVAQLGNEGDTAVAGIRKQLLEGGHHHNSAGEQQGVYDEGFVIVTRKAKAVFLGAAHKIAGFASAPDASGLEHEWAVVAEAFAQLHD